MKGLWKENLSGWNNKGSKRKKQTRKNTLRDNGRTIIHIFDRRKDKENKNVFRYETETELVSKRCLTDKPIVTIVKVYRTFVSWNKIDENGNFIEDYKVKTAYGYERVYYKKEFKELNIYKDENISSFYNKIYFIERTGISIENTFNLTKRQIQSIELSNKRDTQRTILLPKKFIEKAIERKNKIETKTFSEDGMFIYGKPIDSWKIMTFYNDGKRRKYAQKYASSMDRQNVRSWISKGDFNKEIKTHALSKSIAWEIH